MKKQAGTLLLAAVALSSLTGWGFKGIQGEPVARDVYVKGAVAAGKSMAARAQVVSAPMPGNQFIMAPVQCTIEFTDTAYMGQYNSFQTWWVDKDRSADLQKVCDNIPAYFHEGFIVPEDLYYAGPGDVLDNNEALMKKGQYPRGQLGKGRVFSAWEYPEFTRHQTRELLAAAPNQHSVVFLQVRSIWKPTSLSTVDGLGMINYDVYAQIDMRVCVTPDQCSSMIVPMREHEGARAVDLVVPVVRATENKKSNFEEVNQFSRDVFAQAVTEAIRVHWGKLTTK